MATLQLLWDHRRTYDLWSWNMGNTHQTARIIKCIRNRVYTAHIGPRGMEATEAIIVKAAFGLDEMILLNREAEFYSNELRHLQGTVVPKCFGFFRGKVDGVDLGCLLLEYCSGRAPVWNMLEFNRCIMLSVCKIHQAGIIHGDLLDGHHFVKMGDGIRVIDFSSAVRHRCRNGIPRLIGGRGNDAEGQCAELVNMEKTFGFRSDVTDCGRRVQRFWS